MRKRGRKTELCWRRNKVNENFGTAGIRCSKINIKTKLVGLEIKSLQNNLVRMSSIRGNE